MSIDSMDPFMLIEDYKQKCREANPGDSAVIPLPTNPLERKLAMAFAEYLENRGWTATYYPEVVVLIKGPEEEK